MADNNKCTKRKIDKSHLNNDEVLGASFKNNLENVKCDQQPSLDMTCKSNGTTKTGEAANSSKRHDFSCNKEKQQIIRNSKETEILFEAVADNTETFTKEKYEAKFKSHEFVSSKDVLCGAAKLENLKDNNVGDFDDSQNNIGNIFTQDKQLSIRKQFNNKEHSSFNITKTDEAQDLSHVTTQSDFKISFKENKFSTSGKNTNMPTVATKSKQTTEKISKEPEIDLALSYIFAHIYIIYIFCEAVKLGNLKDNNVGDIVDSQKKMGNIFTPDKQGSIRTLIKNYELRIIETNVPQDLSHVPTQSESKNSHKENEITTSEKNQNMSTVATKSKEITEKNTSKEPEIDLAPKVGGSETNREENLIPETISTKESLKTTNSNSAAATAVKANEETIVNEQKTLKQPEVESIDCAICLEPCSPIAFTDPCRHQFCHMCILQWIEFKSVCPLCKRNIKSIHHNIRDDQTYDEHLVPIRSEAASSVTSQGLNAGATRAHNTNVLIPAHLEIDEIFPLVRQRIQRQRQLSDQVGSRVCASGERLASNLRANEHENSPRQTLCSSSSSCKETYECRLCGRVCGSGAGLASHMRAHERQQQENSPKQSLFSSSSSYKETYECGLCGRVCGSGAGLASHMRAHERQQHENTPRQTLFSSSSSYKETYECGLCGRVCGSGAGLASHMRAHERQQHENTPRQTLFSSSSSYKETYECGLCGSVCGSGAGLASHMRAHERQQHENTPRQTLFSSSSSYKETYECGLCGSVCGSGAGLASHMRAHERRQQESYSYQQRPTPSYSSSYSAGSTSYNQRASSHSYSCSCCGMVCRSGAGLASHMRAHARR